MGQITRTNFGICKTVTFTNAQILTFPTDSPIEIIAAIPGKIIVVERVIALFVWVADLTNVDDDTDVISVGFPSGLGADLAFSKNGMFDAGFSTQAGNVTVIGNTPQPVSDRIGGLSLYVTNGLAGDFTGGLTGNILTVKVLYDTLDV